MAIGPIAHVHRCCRGKEEIYRMDTIKREVLSQRVRQVKASGIRKFFDIINTMPNVISRMKLILFLLVVCLYQYLPMLNMTLACEQQRLPRPSPLVQK